MSEPRVEALEQQLGAWPSARPPEGTDVPSLEAEVEWIKQSMAFRSGAGLETANLAGELAKAEAELRRHEGSATGSAQSV
jgi:hypothetical protein